nr:MAG TPA: hypothetical protein [Caudoviricetes sp.]
MRAHARGQHRCKNVHNLFTFALLTRCFVRCIIAPTEEKYVNT